MSARCNRFRSESCASAEAIAGELGYEVEPLESGRLCQATAFLTGLKQGPGPTRSSESGWEKVGTLKGSELRR